MTSHLSMAYEAPFGPRYQPSLNYCVVMVIHTAGRHERDVCVPIQNKDLKSRVGHLEGVRGVNQQDSVVSRLTSRIQDLEDRLQGEKRWEHAHTHPHSRTQPHAVRTHTHTHTHTNTLYGTCLT